MNPPRLRNVAATLVNLIHLLSSTFILFPYPLSPELRITGVGWNLAQLSFVGQRQRDTLDKTSINMPNNYILSWRYTYNNSII